MMKEREDMVKFQLEKRGIKNPAVLTAIRKVPRHKLLPVDCVADAYGDYPLPIGHGQTISQPYIVALMTELMQPLPGHRVLEIGTGSGYQTAVLAEIVREVYTIEIIEALLEKAERSLSVMGYNNIHFRGADGASGWKAKAPFDSIIVTAAAQKIPKNLVAQLKIGGRMIIPIGGADEVQTLYVLEKTRKGIEAKPDIPVRFVPMTGKLQNT
jgi:protein-L-isoaspartate(D-aspartate) O-methyltransferase